MTTQNLASIAGGGATVTMGMAVARTTGDIVVIPSVPATTDITLEPVQGPNTLASTPAGQAAVTMGLGVRYTETTASVGVSTVSATLGVTVFSATTTRGISAFTANRLLVILASDYFTIYPSHPPYAASDVLLAPDAGIGAAQSLFSNVVGVATVSATMGATVQMLTRPTGVASMSPRQSMSYSVRVTSAGVGHLVAYLGSPARITSTSAGRAAFTLNRLGGTARIASTSAGVGSLTAYLGAPQRMTLTSAGRATVTITRIAGTARISTTSAGRATVTAYISSPQRIAFTSAGRATATTYLSSPIRVSSTAAGKGGGILYLGSRVYLAGTSPGRAAATFRQSGTLDLPNIVMRGVGHMNLGPVLLNGYANGVGHLADLRMNPQSVVIASHGVGAFRENSQLLAFTSRGSCPGLHFDLPPFALVCHAGSMGYTISYSIGANEYTAGGSYLGSTGVIAYLSSPLRFANVDPNVCHVSAYGAEGSPSTMQGRSTVSFPYEPKSISNGVSRVTAYEIGRVYMSATTDSYYRYGYFQSVFAYLSSRVYDVATAAGRSTVTFLRFGEFESDGVGGANITLGAPQRMAISPHGVGAWTGNYLPDRRDLAMTVRGVGHLTAYQAGPVHFQAGDVTSHGVGGFFIDPGLLVATSHGVGHVNDITRPTNVFMQWGLGDFYYQDADNFPVADPLLIPRSSSGIAHMEIEIDGIPIMRQKINGVGIFQNDIGGIAKGMRSQTSSAGSYAWQDVGGTHYAPYHVGDSRYGTLHPQGVEIAFSPVEVVWQPNGIGHMAGQPILYYALRLNPHGVGSLAIAGPRQAASTAAGRGGGIWHLTARFANVLRIHGVSSVTALSDTLFLSSGAADVTWVMAVTGGYRYGNMLRYFFVPLPAYGQIWPRRESPTQPV